MTDSVPASDEDLLAIFQSQKSQLEALEREYDEWEQALAADEAGLNQIEAEVCRICHKRTFSDAVSALEDAQNKLRTGAPISRIRRSLPGAMTRGRVLQFVEQLAQKVDALNHDLDVAMDVADDEQRAVEELAEEH
jgi:lipase chaperone LimK